MYVFKVLKVLKVFKVFKDLKTDLTSHKSLNTSLGFLTEYFPLQSL